MHQKQRNYFVYSYLFITSLLLMGVVLTACSISSSNGQPSKDDILAGNLTSTITATAILPLATPIPSATPTDNDTATPSPSVIPTSTIIDIPSPSTTPVASSTPVPTLTPLPTIPPEQRGDTYAELMSSNGGCALPCWWGFELGTASLDEVRQFYMAFDISIVEQVGNGGRAALYITFVDPEIEDGVQVRHLFRVQDGKVIEAEIQLRSLPDYQIVPILQRLGQPSEVWMWTIPEPYEGILPAHFRLYFPEQGILVFYGTGAEKSGDEVKVCFNGLGSATIRLWDPIIWDPIGEKGFVERANDTSELILEGDRPIEEVSNWDTEQFYTILRDDSHSQCLQTPSNLWPSP